MTREEAIRIIRKMLAYTDLTVRANLNADMVDACHLAIKALEQETVSKESYNREYFLRKEFEIKIARLEQQEPILDKIRAEIKTMSGDIETIADVLAIIDKYKAESEE